MTNLSRIIGASICAIVLGLGLSVSAETAETGLGKSVGEAYRQAGKVGKVADSIGIAPSVGGYGAAEQIANYSGVAIGAADGVSNILSGSASSADVGNVMIGGGMVSGMSGITSAGTLLKNYSKLNSLSDLTNMGNLSNAGMNMLKDMTPEIKGLMSMNFDLGLGGLSSLGGALSHPANVWDSQGQQVKNVASAQKDIAVSETKLEHETAVTASRGPAGNMDGRLGKCVKEDGLDYGPSIEYWLEHYADTLEGSCKHLYIGVECDVTIGRGTYLGETISGAERIFMGMTYLDVAGNKVSEQQQRADLRRMYSMLNGCKKASENGGNRGATYNKDCKSPYWENLNGGRHIDVAQMLQASFDEFCDKHIPVWRGDFVRWGKPFLDLPDSCQAFVLDVSMQHGQGRIARQSTLMKQIVNGQLDEAIKTFKSSWMCDNYKNRCDTRVEMLQQCKGQLGFQ